MNQLSLRYAIGATVFFFTLTPPSASLAEDYTFAPRILSTRGDLELNMASQTNENKQDGATSRTTAESLRERLNLAADGFVYHPRFLIFSTRLAGGLNQSVGGTVRSESSSADYELRTVFLPEHPYNLEFFTRHREASSPGTFLRGQATAMDQKGAIFSYRKNPWSLSSSYLDGSTDTGPNKSEAKSYRLNGSHHGRVLSDTASYAHTEAASSSGLRSAHDTYAFGNAIRLAGFTLDSRVNESLSEQVRTLNPVFQTRTLQWTEQISSPLFLGFHSGLSYRYQDERNRTGEGPSEPAKEAFNRSSSSAYNVSHRLYQSLTTNFTLNNSSTKSSTGEVAVRSDTLSSAYTKALPYGRFTAGVQFGNLEADRRGTPEILNEAHEAALFGSFFLAQQNVIESSLVLQVKDPETGGFITLPKSGYLVSLRGGGVQITIESVAPVELQADPAYIYAFLASYSLLNQSKIASSSEGFSIKMDLLENLLSPYYNFFSSNQEVLSGALAGGPDRTTSVTAGVACRVGPYTGAIERQTFRSRLNPSETLRTTAEYRESLGEDSNLSAVLSFAQTDYLPATSPQANSEGSREKRIGTSASMSTRFPAKNLNLSVSGSFSRNNAVIDSDTLSLNGYLTWRLGLVSVSGGAQLSRSESTIATRTVTRDSQYYYVTVSRRLF